MLPSAGQHSFNDSYTINKLRYNSIEKMNTSADKNSIKITYLIKRQSANLLSIS